ncbi:MAG: hypothetical protein ABR521_02460 [Gaiellaceae bacterium]
MIRVGAPIPEATVWLRPREPVSLVELASGGPVLFLFYLFDWSST